MDQKIMLLKKFYDIKIEDYKFHQHKNPISTKDLDINKIVLSNKQNQENINTLLLMKKRYLILLLTK